MIELLVVITIISLLISILLPALRSARDAAFTITCASNQRQLGMAVIMYTEDFDQWFPLHGSRSSTYSNSNLNLWAGRVVAGNYITVRDDLGKYRDGGELPPDSVMACPAVDGPFLNGSGADDTRVWADGLEWRVSHFGFNGNLNLNFHANAPTLWHAARRSNVETHSQPTEIIMFADYKPRRINYIGYKAGISGIYAARNAHGYNQSHDQRHQGQMGNAFWVDGHVTPEPDLTFLFDPGDAKSCRWWPTTFQFTPNGWVPY